MRTWNLSKFLKTPLETLKTLGSLEHTTETSRIVESSNTILETSKIFEYFRKLLRLFGTLCKITELVAFRKSILSAVCAPLSRQIASLVQVLYTQCPWSFVHMHVYLQRLPAHMRRRFAWLSAHLRIYIRGLPAHMRSRSYFYLL